MATNDDANNPLTLYHNALDTDPEVRRASADLNETECAKLGH